MKNKLDGGEAIIEAFRNLGVKYIISSPGSEWSPVWEAMSRQKHDNRPGPVFMDVWHENLAVNMATGYTMMTGETQAVLIHAGVGLLQGAMGMNTAKQSEVPMLVMSGESVSLGEDPDQPMEQQWYGGVSPGGADRLISPLVKWASQVQSAPTLYQSVIRAGEMSRRVPQGPVYLDVALEYMLEDWSPQDDLDEIAATPKKQAASAEVQQFAEDLNAAKNPMIVVENGGRTPEAFNALVRLADTLVIPVIGSRTTAVASFPDDNPMWQGFGNYEPLADADLVFLVEGRAPWFPPSKSVTDGRIVALNENPFKDWMVYQNLQADTYLEGDVATTLDALTSCVESIGIDQKAVDQRRARWTKSHTDYVAARQAERDAASTDGGLNMLSICAAVRDAMPAETIFVDETITHFPQMRAHLPLTQPQCLFKNSVSGLGQGMGLSLGVKLAAPDRPVVLLVGDGSFLYNPIVQALGASKAHELPIIVVVMNNKRYKAMGQGHAKYYGDGVAVEHGFDFGVNIDGPAYQNLGAEFDADGEFADDYEGFKTALKNAKANTAAGRTTIINAVIPE